MDSKSYLTENNVKHPTLELYVADKRVLGNNGCNRLIGSLEILTLTDLKFGPLAGTKMMCQNMELSNQFNANLARVRSYKIEVLQLFMYDEDGTELLVFKKVD
ncbi:META domain-containing protein [Bacteroidia bacterium]|nr:META domain-containing protein [Bacteroidia bacterium]